MHDVTSVLPQLKLQYCTVTIGHIIDILCWKIAGYVT